MAHRGRRAGSARRRFADAPENPIARPRRRAPPPEHLPSLRAGAFLSGPARRRRVNMRYVIVGAVLAAIAAFAFFAGSPMFGGFDSVR